MPGWADLTITKNQEEALPKIHFLDFGGREHAIEVPPGTSVMQAAVENNVPGIDGDCGGACACATCHVYVDPAWQERTGGRTTAEDELLNFAATVQDNSRLACQIRMSDALDGLRVQLPESQH